MPLKSISGIWDDAGNSKFPFSCRGLEEEWDYSRMKSQLLPGEILAAKYWDESGGNEDMKTAAILNPEDFERLQQEAKFWQCFIAVPREAAEKVGLL